MITINSQLNAIDAAHAASTTSSKYGFVSSRAIIDNLTTLGFTPRQIQIHKVRKDERQGFQKHIVRMQHSDLMPKVGDSFPEIVLINSHDGSCRYRMMLGMFRLICTNGMVSGNIEDEINFTHRIANVDKIQDGAMQLVNRASRMSEVMQMMSGRQLDITERRSFVENALQLRYNKPSGDATNEDYSDWNQRIDAINKPRRYEDSANNLWVVFNRVQENLTQGVRGGARRITSPSSDLNVNRELWNLAENLLN